MTSRLTAIYRLRAEPAAIAARARALAVEQSVEMPVEAIDDAAVLEGVLGRVDAISEIEPQPDEPPGLRPGERVFEVRIALAAATILQQDGGGEDGRQGEGRPDPGQLFNMLFGNSSLQDDVALHDVELPPDILAGFAGPNHGVAGLRGELGAADLAGRRRALTCGALKPQGLPPAALADLARRMAAGGVDFIKDDHGLADQPYSPFIPRARAVAGALRRSGCAARYVPSLSGGLDAARAQIRAALDEGIDAFMASPMILGPANFAALARETPQAAFFSHPSLSGLARIAPPLLYGKLFRLLGADAAIFPNHGGRFGYSPETCRRIAEAARAPWGGVAPSLPVPAGGMTLARVPEMLDFYGPDAIVLIGGGLLAAREGLTEQVAAFVDLVARHPYPPHS